MNINAIVVGVVCGMLALVFLEVFALAAWG